MLLYFKIVPRFKACMLRTLGTQQQGCTLILWKILLILSFPKEIPLLFCLREMFNLKLTSEYKLLDTLDVVVDDDGKLGHERFFLKNSAWFWPDFTKFNQCITSVLYFLTFLSLFSWDPIFLNLWDKLARLQAHLPRMSRLDT